MRNKPTPKLPVEHVQNDESSETAEDWVPEYEELVIEEMHARARGDLRS
jgi:hypothetical protein